MSGQIFTIDPSGRWVVPRDLYSSHRSESWRIALLNNADAPLSTLDGAKDGNFTLDMDAVIRASGSLDYSGPDLDWNLFRIQPWYRMEVAGQVEEWPIGVFLVADPNEAHSDAGVRTSLELYDKSMILSQDAVIETYSVPAGTNVIAAVRAVLAAAGQTRTALEESTKVLAQGMAFPVGTSRLEIINQLLESINYLPIHADGEGVFRAEPHREEKDLARDYGFVDDSTSIYSPDFSRKHDSFEAPNRFVCIGQSSGDWPAPVGIAEDTSGGPLSYQGRGNRWVTKSEESVDADSLDTITALAKRKLAEAQRSGSTLEIEHAPIPLEVGSAVGFKRDARGIDVSCMVKTITYSMGTGALCSTTLREVS